jgi:biotin carboxyl carrier protein
VPEPRPIDDSAADGHAADHAAIDRLASELLPALIAKLGATGLGELEVRQDGWRVRLRRPADGVARGERRTSGGAARSQPGHSGHGHGPLPTEGTRQARAAASTNGSGPGGHVAVGPGHASPADVPADGPAMALSPAVGMFRPDAETKAGRRVRSGDRLGVVDMLGVPHEVVSPVDGILGEQLVEGGEAVEYGQELVVIEFAQAPATES